jgi:hypothetical protein
MEQVMSHALLATLLWSALGASVVLTIAGVGTQRSWPVFVAAGLSLGFAVMAMFSIGIFILPLTIVQATLGFRLCRSSRQSGVR